MRSSRSRHIWLIHPQDPLPPVTPIDCAGGDSVHFSPTWDLICLQAFILERTGHTCEHIDIRLFDSTASALSGLKDRLKYGINNMAVIYATLLNIGLVGHLTEYIHQTYPDVEITLFGPYVLSFPDTLHLIPHVNYGLCGDPEHILRNLLDFSDIELRLKLLPGLLFPGSTSKPPHWISNLHAVSLPDWHTINWSSYHTDLHAEGIRMEARLSRGYPDTPSDRMCPVPHEPLRLWPLSVMAHLLQKCPGHGITEVFFSDPSGFWSRQRVLEWCKLLTSVHNTQPWAFQMIPRMMQNDEIAELSRNGCQRIELVIPLCDEDILKHIGFELNDVQLKQLIGKLQANHIKAQLVYWVHGPGDNSQQTERVLRYIKIMNASQYSIYPFPFHPDSKLYQMLAKPETQAKGISAWIAWAQNSTTTKSPAALWSGTSGIVAGQKTMQSIQHRIVRNPWLRLKRLVIRYGARFRPLTSIPVKHA